MRDYTAFWTPNADGDSATGQDSTTTYDDTQGAEVFFIDFIDPALLFYDPRIDWTAQNFINADDFNAIEWNGETVKQFLESIQYEMPALTTVTNRTQASVDFLTSINRIENNLDAIRSAFLTPPSYQPKKVWTLGKGFNNNDAIRLEQNIKLLMDYGLLVYQSFRYCGATICGDGGGLI
ncbi:hypothetical protein [Paenibacillus sp. sgz302251]|uniref:hypothetical protein n=1 Tax=Paenibacillus sp. sgz302251 TaxID=3414493 RepID=UPI003C7D8B3E